MSAPPEVAGFLRVFVGGEDSYHGRPLCEAILAQALENGMAEATVLTGPEGYGCSRHLRTEANIDAGPRLPMVIEIVATEEATNAFLPFLHEMIDSGLITLGAIHYRHQGHGKTEQVTPGARRLTRPNPSVRNEAKWLDSLEGAMDVPHDAVLLRIFTSTADRFGLDPLHHAIVLRAREMHLAGATVFRGSLGFGQSAKLHKGEIFRLSQDLPVVVEIVDSEENINAFLPVLDEMMESGLVTTEPIKVLQYGRERAGTLQRIADRFRRRLRVA